MDERIAVLEIKVEELTKKLDEHIKDSRAEGQSLGEKIDSLIEIKHKGVGAFWLASALLGSGIIGSFAAFLQWIRG